MPNIYWFPIIIIIICFIIMLYDDYRTSHLCRKGKAARKHKWRVNMTTYHVLRGGNLMKATHVRSEAEKEYEALAKRHPLSNICLTKVDVLLSTPAQQAFNQKRDQTL